MKLLISTVLLAAIVAVVKADIPGLTKGCPDKPQPANDAGCMYYCQGKSGDWEYGVYPDQSTCDYLATRDGVCKGGLCYPSESKPAPPQRPDNANHNGHQENQDSWEDK